jgi:hypothetical protein
MIILEIRILAIEFNLVNEIIHILITNINGYFRASFEILGIRQQNCNCKESRIFEKGIA